jgi:leucyl/phenylalanyl-tRNA--protein transferase
MPIFALTDDLIFPPPHLAEPDGALAIGGDLSAERLILAYRSGIFPWYNPGEPPIWWSPDPRFVLYPSKLKVSKSMRQVLRKDKFRVTFDQNFDQVIRNCQQIRREGQRGTWITDEMVTAYLKLHEMGIARSVEVWEAGELVGGLYGLAMGKCYFGESMFSKVSNASKTGFIKLVHRLEEQGCQLIDCQIYTAHLESLGAELIPRERFLKELEEGMGG